MTGYFRLKRGIFEHPIFDHNQPFSPREAWIWLIEKTNYSDSQFRHKGSVYSLARGCYAGSYRSLAEAWNWSPNRVIRETKVWQKESMIVLETERGFLQISLCNYDKYQSQRKSDGTPTEQQRNADGTQTDTNQIKETKGKKGSNNSPPVYSPEFDEFWATYPRNNGEKFEALKSYLKARKDTDHGRIIEGARSYREFCESQGTERKYVKHASTWLNARGWDTERDNLQPLPTNRTGGSAGGATQPKRSQWEIAGANVLEKIRKGEF